MADTTGVIDILNHHRIAVKIPTRSFLMDLGLVGASVFVLVCLGQPKSESWVATVQHEDGTTHSVRVDYRGDDIERVRQSILSELVPPESEKRGLARWQSETSRFYAQADSQRMDSPIENGPQEVNRVFQTASFQAESDAQSRSAESAEGWIGFWNRRGDQSASWLDKYSNFHQQRVARISESLVVARVGAVLPAREGVWLALATAIVAVGLGLLWCRWIPRRTLPGHPALPGLAALPGEISSSTESAAMSFRSSWVRLRQPLAVEARRACGWFIVLSAMVAIGGRLL